MALISFGKKMERGFQILSLQTCHVLVTCEILSIFLTVRPVLDHSRTRVKLLDFMSAFWYFMDQSRTKGKFYG